MLKHRSQYWRSLIPITAITAALVIGGGTLPGWAKFNPPGNLRRPGSRVGLATRGGTDLCSADSRYPLTTLVPKTLEGRTLSGYPTFYWFMPNRNTYASARFDLYEVKEADQHLVYRSEFQISGQAGIASLSLPADTTVSPLEMGKSYRWMLVLVCPDRPSRNIFAEGWVERVSPSDQLKEDLAAANPEDRINLYGEAGLWYDLVKALADQRQAKAADLTLAKEWQDLMESEVVDLSKLANQPFVMPEQP